MTSMGATLRARRAERVAAPLERAKTATPSTINRQWSVAARHRAIIRARAPRDKRAALGLGRAKASRRSRRAPKVDGMTRTRCPRDAWRRRRAICLQAHLAPPASTPREPRRTSPRRQGSVRGLRRVRNDTRTTAPPTLNACAGGNRLQRPCVAKAGKTAPLTALSRARRGATRAASSVPDQPGPISGLPGYTVS